MHKIYEELSSVFKIILVLSHGQSAVFWQLITPSTIQITKKMQRDYKCAPTKYEIYPEQEKKKKSKIENDNRKSIINEEISGVKTLIIEKEKVFSQFRMLTKKSDMSFVKKANALKRSRDETDDIIKTLQKTLISLDEKSSKM